MDRAIVSGGSLRRQLLTWLLLPQLVLWFAAATVSYNVALSYAHQANDRSLYMLARALARQVKPIGSGLLIDFPRAAQDIIETDPDDQVYYTVSSPPGQFILGNHKLSGPPAGSPLRDDRPTFYDGAVIARDGVSIPVRVGAIALAWGEAGNQQTMMVQVAKSRISREALASGILLDTVLPLSVLMLMMSALVWAGVRNGLAPLTRLRDAVGGRAPNNLAPIELKAAPEEVRDLAVALNSLLLSVHENVVVQRRFISDAAHQLRTPLAGLKGQTELALKEAGDPLLRARLERVNESATRSVHLVTQLLTLARAEPESVSAVGRSCFDLRRMVHELTAELVPRALGQGVDLGLDEADGDDETALPVEGQALLIREAVINLIDNAIRYAGRHSEVTVRVHAGGPGLAVVEVDDNGPGLPAELHERVFERFFRATHDSSGCGLGLAIVREIVERHRGRTELESLKPRGLRARIVLPLSSRPAATP
ncbi:two-component system sensor histidine kinase TctE [Sphaerotilus hippei]|uniref:histidine kinase n=1 Tax=Sphaerotilus hippei TaxID=744406 RepID=A0A318H4P4_9BURK|nr:sensor histidine kinase [Sphaerotilus hippei]PXW98141.1 two-component system sensor histidine kinase TctE [Sphaerotilus hippei]